MGKDKSNSKGVERESSINSLEADVAYFDARLSLLGNPSTQYQAAQLKTYRLLEGLLIQNLVCLRVQPLNRQQGVEDKK